ncbi:phosphotransferase family protein [Georgenia yuyongxinii]|uniref:Aminoglycoside phosphotransferase family protein n=1 Tax=Georgenia yuyongxinii TaxID=2589797 RepID=A0A552WJA7_9MICO|nr:aminoglycoside phosphotransferase family protein [Georgenia yuyongxinii]TRW42838.1 aminoglycoside phosphotransferase family protein [Georgenia yuyongxinii]
MSVPVAAQHEPADVALLTGPEAGPMLAGALGVEGSHLVDWQVHTIHHRPGAGVTVGYTVTVERQVPGAGSALRSEEYLCATTARLSQPAGPGLVRLEQEGEGPVVHLWRHPADPELPALPVACDASLLSRRLGTPVTVELLAYRPTRRAVLRVRRSDPTATAYLKVVRPSGARVFADRHRMLTAAGVPAPEVLRADDDGLVLLGEGRGTPLSNLLARGVGRAAPAVLTALLRVLDALPAAVLDLPRRPAWAERAQHYAHAAATVLPQHADRTKALADGVESLLAASDPGPVVPSHGDFYEANVLMDPREDAVGVTALLDVDAVGPGHRVDDLACLLGHVSVLPHLAPTTYPHVPDLLERWTRSCEQLVDPVALHARSAGVVLSLVAGARRSDGAQWRADAEGRLARAESWLARGREVLAQRGPH